ELFYLQVGLSLRRKARNQSTAIRLVGNRGALSGRMRELLPFKLTGAQQRVLREIEIDMESNQPMQRLVQGDVGSGKTMVAWLGALKSLEQSYQGLWMGPPDI